MIDITADFQSSQNYLMESLLLDIADLFFQSSYRSLCLTVKNHVVEKTGPFSLPLKVLLYSTFPITLHEILL
jgi:hypothetical protein